MAMLCMDMKANSKPGNKFCNYIYGLAWINVLMNACENVKNAKRQRKTRDPLHSLCHPFLNAQCMRRCATKQSHNNSKLRWSQILWIGSCTWLPWHLHTILHHRTIQMTPFKLTFGQYGRTVNFQDIKSRFEYDLKLI